MRVGDIKKSLPLLADGEGTELGHAAHLLGAEQGDGLEGVAGHVAAGAGIVQLAHNEKVAARPRVKNVGLAVELDMGLAQAGIIRRLHGDQAPVLGLKFCNDLLDPFPGRAFGLRRSRKQNRRDCYQGHPCKMEYRLHLSTPKPLF